MKTCLIFTAAVLAGYLCVPARGLAQAAPGNAFIGALPSTGSEGEPAEGVPADANSPDRHLYADGTLAINQGRWVDAEAIFSKIAEKNGEHADGARYWKAYAENKLGRSSEALDVCSALRHDYPSSSWLDECGALEIEIHAKSGQPVQPKAGEDDELKLLALNSLMHQDEKKALSQIDEILNGGNASERLKQGAVFILGQYHSDATYPQIVRVSYVEGDVRVSRGLQNEKVTGAAWEKAVADLPLETGFSLVTGDGRAEVEFENASTLYLGENSVLTFNELSTTAGIPRTEVALLSGTVSLRIKPFVAGEGFLLRTPTDTVLTKYPFTNNLRITSYMDGMAVTAMDNGLLHLSGDAEQQLSVGQTLYYRGGHAIDPLTASDGQSMTAWDKWVADREAVRSKAIAEVMTASGMTTPIPGMEAMAGRGTFFDCAPYGTCWEPASASSAQQADHDLTAPGQIYAQAQMRGPNSAQDAEEARLRELYASFPCIPYGMRSRMLLDATFANSGLGFQTVPWDWAVCHAGSWIHHRGRYVWVSGHRRHHRGAGQWVKSGHTVAYVPLHPHDVKDHLPVNRTNPVFALGGKGRFEPLRLDGAHPVELMKDPPKEFRIANLPPLAKADEPRMEAHQLKPAAENKLAAAHPGGIPIHFDHKAQSFNMAHQVMQGGKQVTVFVPVSNRSGDLQARSGSYGGAGSHAGSSGGGSHGGGGTVSSSGGGSHSSGASSSSSGGGGASSSSSSSAASSSAPSSSGGSHR